MTQSPQPFQPLQPPQPPPANDDQIGQFIRRAAKERPAPKELHPLEPERRTSLRNTSGLLIGGLIGLVFGIMSQMVNVVLLFGLIRFHTVLFAVAVTIVVTILGVLFGLVSSSRSRHQTQFILGSIAIFFLLILVAALVWGKGDLFLRVAQAAGPIFLLSWVILGLGVLVAPLIAALYWAAELQVKYFYRPWWAWQRVLLPLAILLLTGLYGSQFIVGAEELRAMREMDSLLKSGLAAVSAVDVPDVLQQMEGAKFYGYARGENGPIGYYLSAEQLAEPDNSQFLQGVRKNDVFVQAQFDNGYWMECRFGPGGTVLRCWSHYEPSIPGPNG